MLVVEKRDRGPVHRLDCHLSLKAFETTTLILQLTERIALVQYFILFNCTLYLSYHAIGTDSSLLNQDFNSYRYGTRHKAEPTILGSV